MLEPGDQIHHYVVEEAVGGGGMAQVFRVRHAILGHTLALKVLDPQWVSSPRVRQRFLAEGRIMAMVRHPAIVMVTDAVVDAQRGVAGLVMEFVEGPDLKQVMDRLDGPADPELLSAVMIPVLEGMHHVHQEGVIHRDLKPANVLLSRDAAGRWHPRVVDFGVAHVTDEALLTSTPRRVTRSGARIGTPAFMAPEQVRGETPDLRWDVFALGVVLFELATGVHPFEVDDGDEERTMEAIAAGNRRDPREAYPGLDPRLEGVLLRATAHDPDTRFDSCADMAEALSRALGPRPIAARPAPLPAPTPQASAPPVAAATLVYGDIPSRRRKWDLTRDEVTVGTDADVRLPHDGSVEDHHCTLRFEGGSWVLVDTSVAGSRVNGARVRRVELAHGDLIRLGHTVLRFQSPGSRRSPTARAAHPVSEAPRAASGPRLERGDRVWPVTLAGVVVGRDPEADIVLDDPTVARRHCRLRLMGLDVVVEDLDSANGTWVDGQRVRFRQLRGGEELRVGQTRITFHRR